MSLLKINEEISNLYDLYNDDECREKLLEFIQKDLSEKMLGFWERRERHDNLKKMSDFHINNFLVNYETQYFYIPNSEIYISYNDEHFKIINESELLHTILTGISQNKSLLPWKHKIKLSIIKQIKDKSLFDIIPESQTIQFVLNQITPLLLKTKEETKYFLTILGDNILKKNSDLFHIVDVSARELIDLLEDNAYHFFKNTYHINTTFKFNWHDHDYSKCRLLKFNPAVKNSAYWRSFIKYHILDIMVVAVHYSKRYGNSDEFILSKYQSIPSLTPILFLHSNTKEEIVSDFIDKSIISVNNPGVALNWKEMQYTWKVFLIKNNLPNIIFYKELKNILKQKLKVENELFTNVTSLYQNYIKDLQSFWKENIVPDDNEFEVSELCELYEYWLKNTSKSKKSIINEGTMITLTEHFFDVKLENQKIFQNISCKLWNKQQEMKAIIENIRISINFSPDMFEKSIQNIYEEYCSRAKSQFNYRIVSKKYFEKYINKIIPSEFIIGKRISNEYWKS